MGDKEADARQALQYLQQGMLAYQRGSYHEAVDFLSQGLSLDAEDWECRLYLAMAYYRTGRVALSRREFQNIMNGCLDRNLRLKAAAALAATNPHI
jgi:Flp pilus assembly protein TadD